MKHLLLGTAILSITLFSCHNETKTDETTKDSTVKITTIDTSKVITVADPAKDKAEIQTLIRKVLNNHPYDILPAVFNPKDSLCTGFDMNLLNQTLAKLKASGDFSATFIENYKQIILTLDKKFRTKQIAPWNGADLPTFIFANDVDPWCDCQDNLSWDEVEVTAINLNSVKGEMIWKWGNLQPGQDKSWKEFSYKFNVEKENGVWKISYLQGFDFKEGTRNDGI